MHHITHHVHSHSTLTLSFNIHHNIIHIYVIYVCFLWVYCLFLLILLLQLYTVTKMCKYAYPNYSIIIIIVNFASFCVSSENVFFFMYYYLSKSQKIKNDFRPQSQVKEIKEWVGPSVYSVVVDVSTRASRLW